MTPVELTAWRRRHDFTQEEAGNMLGVSKRSISNYETIGPVPKAIALACEAISISEGTVNYEQLIREQHPKLAGFFL
ncbi:helix-turn-helix domain-containing protein [Methylobacterium mesophilicum]|uniref:helix-turn-helix domain-containing protein n=1 Tax=Methylobacterium mesophilicum TaxID=39956 RepID=UPI003D7B8866